MNIALLQLHCRAGHPENNTGLIRRAVEGAVIASKEITGDSTPLLCAAPELALCGSPLEGLPHVPGFVDRCMTELAALAEALRHGPPVVLGTLDYNADGEPESAVYLLEAGSLRRLCSRPLAHALSFGLARESVVQARSAICCFTIHGRNVGLWLGTPNPSLAHAACHADAHLNLDAAPFDAHFWPKRRTRLTTLATALNRPLLRVNPVGGNGGWIFPGGSMSLDAYGHVRTEAAPFQQELLLESLPELDAPCLPDLTPHEESPWESHVWDALVLGIRDFVRHSGFSGVVLGLSGGMDSALVAALAVDALDAKHVRGVLMPSPWSSRGSIDDSMSLAANLGIATHTIPIASLMDDFDAALAPLFAERKPDVTEENIQARIRGTLLMAISNKFGCMVLSTGNKSESAAGYGTLYGDLAGSLAPIADLFKTEVYALARWGNRLHGRELIPETVFTKPPSAELRPDQKDEDSLPPYEALDAFVRAELAGEPSDCLPPDEASRIRSLLRRSEFKRHQSAQPLFVSARPLALHKRPLPV